MPTLPPFFQKITVFVGKQKNASRFYTVKISVSTNTMNYLDIQIQNRTLKGSEVVVQ